MLGVLMCYVMLQMVLLEGIFDKKSAKKTEGQNQNSPATDRPHDLWQNKAC